MTTITPNNLLMTFPKSRTAVGAKPPLLLLNTALILPIFLTRGPLGTQPQEVGAEGNSSPYNKCKISNFNSRR
jgi:hypothetical protein